MVSALVASSVVFPLEVIFFSWVFVLGLYKIKFGFGRAVDTYTRHAHFYKCLLQRTDCACRFLVGLTAEVEVVTANNHCFPVFNTILFLGPPAVDGAAPIAKESAGNSPRIQA